MAASPRFKVYNPSGVYVASCKHVEDAAAVVANWGDGSTIRDGSGPVVWREGSETIPAGESFDNVHAQVWTRINSRGGTADGD